MHSDAFSKEGNPLTDEGQSVMSASALRGPGWLLCFHFTPRKQKYQAGEGSAMRICGPEIDV